MKHKHFHQKLQLFWHNSSFVRSYLRPRWQHKTINVRPLPLLRDSNQKHENAVSGPPALNFGLVVNQVRPKGAPVLNEAPSPKHQKCKLTMCVCWLSILKLQKIQMTYKINTTKIRKTRNGSNSHFHGTPTIIRTDDSKKM